jgi:hypothetical protein
MYVLDTIHLASYTYKHIVEYTYTFSRFEVDDRVDRNERLKQQHGVD